MQDESFPKKLLYQGYLPASAKGVNSFIFCEMCLFKSLRYFFFHNFKGLKWIPLYKRMAPNFKTTTWHIVGFHCLIIKQ